MLSILNIIKKLSLYEIIHKYMYKYNKEYINNYM